MADCREFPRTPPGLIPGTVQVNLLALRQEVRSLSGVRFEITTAQKDETTWDQLSPFVREEITEQFYNGLCEGTIFRGRNSVHWRAMLTQND